MYNAGIVRRAPEGGIYGWLLAVQKPFGASDGSWGRNGLPQLAHTEHNCLVLKLSRSGEENTMGNGI